MLTADLPKTIQRVWSPCCICEHPLYNVFFDEGEDIDVDARPSVPSSAALSEDFVMSNIVLAVESSIWQSCYVESYRLRSIFSISPRCAAANADSAGLSTER